MNKLDALFKEKKKDAPKKEVKEIVFEDEKPAKKEPKPNKKQAVNKDEKYDIQIVENYGDIQTFDDFQYIPSKRAIAESIDMYRYLMKSIIKESDFHYIKENRFLKRSGFRKIAQAFGITLEQIGEEKVFKEDNEIYARVKVRASLGHVDHKAIEIGMKLLIDSGKINIDEIGKLLMTLSKTRHADGVGIVAMSEIKFGKNQTRHNLVGYAFTRGASRAIADLVGFGVVSATEVDVNEDKEDWF